MVLTDSSFAESMNAHVFTTSTSASAGLGVSVCPPCSDNPIMTSESTRFFGQPNETNPIFIKALLSQLYYPNTEAQRHGGLVFQEINFCLCDSVSLCWIWSYGVTRYIIRGNGIASRTCSRPQIHPTT